MLELARMTGNPCAEADVDSHQLAAAQEIFLTGTGIGIAPIVELDGRPVGDGTPGPFTAELTDAYAALVASEGTPL